MEGLKLYNLIDNFGFILDNKANIVEVLPIDGKPLGFSIKSFVGKAFVNFISNDCKFKYLNYFKKKQLNEPFVFECEIDCKNKKKVWYRISIVFVTTAKVSKYIVHFNNINELKKQLLKTEETVRELKRANIINHQIIYSSRAIILRLDIGGFIVSVSKGLEKMIGFKTNDLIGRHWFNEIFPKTKFSQYKKQFIGFIKSKNTSNTFVAPIICKDGTQKTISWKTNKIIVDGKLIGTLGIGKDITEINRKMDLIQESETRFKTLAQLVQIPLSFISLDGTITFVNKAYTKEYGFQLAEIPNVKSLLKLCYKSPAARKAAFATWEQELKILKRDKKILFKHAEIYTKNGVKKVIEYSAVLNNDFIYYSYLDITSYLEKEQLLLQSRETFKRIAENTSVAIAGADAATFKVVFANKRFVDILGYTQTDINLMEDWGDLLVYDNQTEKEESLIAWEKVKMELLNNSEETIKILERKVFCKNGMIKNFEIAITYDRSTIYALFYDITERKISEQKLLESEKRFRKLAELLPTPISCKTTSDKIIFLNQSYTQKFGYTLDDIPDFDSWLKKAYRNDKDRIAAYKLWKSDIVDLQNGKKTPARVLEIYNKQGQKRFVSHTTTISEDSIYCAYNDITEQLEFEKKINESEQRFRNIIEHLPIPLVSIKPITGDFFSNKQHQNLIGHHNSSNKKAKDFSKFSIDDLVDENSKKHFAKLIEKIKKNDEGTAIYEPTYCVKILCKDKVIRTFEITENIFGNTLYTVFHDITEQIKATELLVESEQKFKALAENMPIAIGAYDTTGKTIFINKHFVDTTGYTIKDVPTIKEWYHQTQPNAKKRFEFYEYWNHTVENFRNGTLKVKPEIKASSRCKDGSFKYFTYSFSIFNTTTYILLIDITEQERAKKELEKSYQELRSLASHLQNIREEERKKISREIHDQLGQQLTGIKMDVSAIFKKMKSAKTVQEIEFNQVLDLLNLSVKTVRKISSELRPSLLDDLGLSAAIEWQALEFSKRASVICNFNNNLNNQTLSPEVQSNLFRIVQESLTNIMRHAQAKNVVIDLQNNADTIFVNISDDGKGFNKNLPTSTLGLLGMQERAIMMSGKFEVESSKGNGTTVKISVPIKPIKK